MHPARARHPRIATLASFGRFDRPAVILFAGTMLSRTADNLYWLARYVERAEYLARVLEATLRLTALPLAYVGSTNEWESAVATAGLPQSVLRPLHRGQRGERLRIPGLLDREPVLDPQLHRDRPHTMPARCAPRSPPRPGRPSTAPGSSSSASATARPRARNFCASCTGCRKPRCASTARPTAPCCATTSTGSPGSASISSAPTTPRAFST